MEIIMALSHTLDLWCCVFSAFVYLEKILAFVKVIISNQEFIRHYILSCPNFYFGVLNPFTLQNKRKFPADISFIFLRLKKILSNISAQCWARTNNPRSRVTCSTDRVSQVPLQERFVKSTLLRTFSTPFLLHSLPAYPLPLCCPEKWYSSPFPSMV